MWDRLCAAVTPLLERPARRNDSDDVVIRLAAVSEALDRAGFAVAASGLQQCPAEDDGVHSSDVERVQGLLSLA